MLDDSSTLPSGVEVVTRVTYTRMQSRGPLALAVTASISLCAVAAILIAMTISGFKTRHQFIRSQVGAYFLSLVISDLIQATGSVMNSKWVVIQGVTSGPFCTAQAVLKQTGNVGIALWSLVIAVHTFCLLFLRLRIGDHLFYATLVGVWLFIGFIVMMGPVILQRSANGPFWGISGYWCWITDGYHVEQLSNEYLFMFLAAGVSFVLYSLIFFRLRGNLQGVGWRLKFRRVKEPWIEDDTDEAQMSTAGKQILWYPVAYTIIIFPISVCRWSAIFGHRVPYWATMTADSIFMLSGFVNAILYSTTRKIVSVRLALAFSHLIRIGPSRRKHTTTSKPDLDDMESARAVSPCKDKDGMRQAHIISVIPHKLWDSSRSIRTLTDDTHDCSPPQRSWKIDNDHTHPVQISPVLAVTQDGLDFEPTRPVATPRSVNDEFSANIPRVSTSQTLPDARKMGEIPSGSVSETSMTTDGTSPSRHKRFSAWSLPSLRGDSRSCRTLGQESVHTDLEEMQFAPPSPEPPPRRKLPPSHSDMVLPRPPGYSRD